MTNVLHACAVYDVEQNSPYIECVITKWTPGIGWKESKIWIYTEPKGNWIELKFTNHECVKLVDFLNCMVVKNVEVARRVAVLACEQTRSIQHAVKCLKYIDGTFKSPKFNTKMRWQYELLNEMWYTWSKVAINSCNSIHRLTIYAQNVQ